LTSENDIPTKIPYMGTQQAGDTVGRIAETAGETVGDVAEGVK
jgi:hypothetical protein